MVNCNYNEVTAIFTANFEVIYMYIKDRYAILRHICLFVFFVLGRFSSHLRIFPHKETSPFSVKDCKF